MTPIYAKGDMGYLELKSYWCFCTRRDSDSSYGYLRSLPESVEFAAKDEGFPERSRQVPARKLSPSASLAVRVRESLNPDPSRMPPKSRQNGR